MRFLMSPEMQGCTEHSINNAFGKCRLWIVKEYPAQHTKTTQLLWEIDRRMTCTVIILPDSRNTNSHQHVFDYSPSLGSDGQDAQEWTGFDERPGCILKPIEASPGCNSGMLIQTYFCACAHTGMDSQGLLFF